MMFRRTNAGHRLKGTKRTETPSNFLFVSVSGCDDGKVRALNECKQSLRLWHAVAFRWDGKRTYQHVEKHGATVTEFLLFCDSRQRPRNPLWMYCYDACYAFSLLRLWNALDEGVFSVGPIVASATENRVRGNKPWKGFLCLESSPVFASLMGRTGPVTFCDVQNYFHCGVRQLADALDVAALPLPADEASDEDHLDYLRQQTAIISETMMRLVKNWKEKDCGSWQKTAASLAFASYKRFIGGKGSDGQCPAPIVARDEDCERVERQAFHGAWTEPFFLGEVYGTYHKLDIASQYPAVMRDEKFPVKRIGRLVHISREELWHQMQFRGACAEVVINSPVDTYPVLHNGYLTYARGRFVTFLAGVELKRAVDKGHVEWCHEAVLYEVTNLFRNWVDYWYPMKQQNALRGEQGLAERQLAKLILNSLWAKFAQRGNRWVTLPGQPCPVGRWGYWLDEYPDGSLAKCRAIANIRQEWREGEPPKHYFPAISAFVTAAARERMRDLMALLPFRSCLYIGTDMLIVDDDGYKTLRERGMIGVEALGLLQHKSTHRTVNICAPMWYRLDEEWTRNGHWGRAKEDENGNFRCDTTDRLPTILATEPDGTITIRTHQLAPSERWAKGVVLPDGWIEPYTLRLDKQPPAMPER